MKETTGKEGSKRISSAMLEEMLDGLDPFMVSPLRR